MSENNVSEQKIKDLCQIFTNMYEMAVTHGGVELNISEILLAVNAFHARVVLDIGLSGEDGQPMAQERMANLCEGSVKAFKQALEQEAI
jgi:hypothetical protein